MVLPLNIKRALLKSQAVAENAAEGQRLRGFSAAGRRAPRR